MGAARTLLDRWILSRLDVAGRRRCAAALDAYDASARDAGDRGVRRRAVELVRPTQPAPLLEGRAGRRTSAPPTPPCTGAGRRRRACSRRSCRTWPRRCGRTWSRRSTPGAPDSVHLADFPERARAAPRRGARGRESPGARSVALGRTARAASGVRDPAAAAPRSRVKLPGGAGGFAADAGGGRGADRGGPRRAEREGARAASPTSRSMVERTLYPLLPVIGPRHGERGRARSWRRRAAGEWRLLDDGRVEVGGVTLAAGRVPAHRAGAAGPRGGRGGRPAGRARHAADAGAGGRGPGARGRASAADAAQGGRLRDQRPG